MPPKQRKITEVLMQCHRCGWIGQVYECDCDSVVLDRFALLYPPKETSQLRCPKCAALVKQINEG